MLVRYAGKPVNRERSLHLLNNLSQAKSESKMVSARQIAVITAKTMSTPHLVLAGTVW